ncbi:TPA: TonB-dependent receptor [Citrobacter freundii]
MIVTANAPANQSDSAAGSGFVADDIELGPLGNKQWIDTPYSSNTISQQVIKNQQAQSVNDLLKYAPSTQMEARGGLDVGRPQSRGMEGSVVANSRLDGLNIVSTTAFPVEMLERLDVVNSLTGALYGPASPAGQFNFVQKRPTPEAYHSMTLNYQGRSAYSGHLDLGDTVGDNKQFGYRLNLLDEDGEGDVVGSTLRRKLAAIALDWTIRPGTELQLNASHYEFIQKGYPGGFSYSDDIQLPKAPDPQNKNLSLATSGEDLTTDTVSTKLINYFTPDWYLTTAVGYQQADRAMRNVTNKITNNQGDIDRSIGGASAAGRFRVLSDLMTLNGHFMTGSWGHDIALSTTGYEQISYSATNKGATYDMGTTNMYDPDSMIEPSDGKIESGGDRYKSGTSSQQNLTVGDTVAFNRQWSAMFFLSQSWMQTQSYAKTGEKTDQDNQQGLSPEGALMYKITPNVMTYISYADSLEMGDTAPDEANNAGQTLDPFRSQQLEFGVKVSAGDMNYGAALFRLKRPFAYVDDDNNFGENGDQLNKGLELTATGNVWSTLNVYSGVTLLDPKLEDTGNEETTDKRVVGVPKVQGNILFEYNLPSVPSVVYSANVHYTGKRAANDTNTSWADSYTTLDLGLRYNTRIKDVDSTWRVGVTNVTDEHYWASIFPGDINGAGGSESAFPGPGREVRASVSFDF